MGENLKVHRHHLLKADMDPKEVDELEAVIRDRFKHSSDVLEIYLTPSANWSDHCIHEYLNGNNQHREGYAPFCQLNGAAVKVTKHARVRDLFKSADILGCISFYDVNVSVKADDPTVVSATATELQKEFVKKLPEIKKVLEEFFSSKQTKTSSNVFKEYYTGPEEEEEVRFNLMKLKGNMLKIASRNGFVYVGIYPKTKGGLINYTIKFCIRSYDEMKALEILEKIYRENPSVEHFAGSSYTVLRETCKKNAEIQQGHIAYRIINEVLGWNTGKTPDSAQLSYGGNNINFLPANNILLYNWIKINQDGTYTYFDHCYPMAQIQDNGYWPYFTGRESGLSILECDEFFSSGIWHKDLECLPMGPRKLLHRSKQKITSEYNSPAFHETELPKLNALSLKAGGIVWRGQGWRNYKLITGKYSSVTPAELLENVYGYNGECRFVKLHTWSVDFVQEFGPNTHHTMGIVDRLFLEDTSEVILPMSDKFYMDHFARLIKWGAGKDYIVDDILLQQNNEKEMLLLSREKVIDYMKENYV